MESTSKPPLPMRGPRLRQRGVGHQQNRRVAAGALLETLQLAGRAGEDHLRREAQADRFVTQLARPLLQVVAGRHQDQDRLPGPEVFQPVLDAHHADHGLAAARRRLDQLPVIAIAAEHRVGFVLVGSRVRRADQVGKSPGAGVLRPVLQQRLDQVDEERPARLAQAGDLTEALAKRTLPDRHVVQPGEVRLLQPGVKIRPHQGAQAGGVDVHVGVGALGARIAGRTLAGGRHVAGSDQILEMPLHRPLRHAHHIQVVRPLHDAVQFDRLRAFLQRPHHQVAGKLVASAAVQHERHRHIGRRTLVHLRHGPVQRGQVAHGRLGQRLFARVERRAQDVDRAAVIDRQPVVGAALRGGIVLLDRRGKRVLLQFDERLRLPVAAPRGGVFDQ